MMFIKEDLIISQHNLSFYDLIESNARGKVGYLFDWDRPVEKLQQRPIYVTNRAWFERNKHMYPASAWESYDSNNFINKDNINDPFVQIFTSIKQELEERIKQVVDKPTPIVPPKK